MEEISISVGGISHPILCGKCKQPVAFIGKPDVETGRAGCLNCDNVAGIREVASIAVEYAKEEAQLMLNRAAKEAASRSKIIKFQGPTSHTRDHRFVVQFGR